MTKRILSQPGGFLVAQKVKRLPAMQETWVRSLGQEDPLEGEMATHSSTLAGRIPWTEEPGGLQSTGSQRAGHDWETSLSFSFTFYSSRAPSSHLILFSGAQWEESLVSEMWAGGMRLQILQHSSEDPVNACGVVKRAGVRLTPTGIFAFDSENHGPKSKGNFRLHTHLSPIYH